MSGEELRMTDEEVLRTMELLLELWDKGGQELCEALLKEDDDGNSDN